MALSGLQVLLAVIAVIFFVTSLIFYVKTNRGAVSLVLLFIGTLTLRLFYASLDPFLNEWDEQVHALVAKNMLDHPLVPTLFETPAFDYVKGNWIEEHIWLHKQPLFLWQISLSYKIFGLSELSTRLPSIILSSLIVFFIYRIGKISINQRAGFIGAFLYAAGYYSLELIVDRFPTDHNDISFLFYITASFWAWTEYSISQKLRWVFIIGIFSGMAVLVKWLTGLLVFSGWGVSIFAQKETRAKLSSYFHLALAFAVALLVFLPWQLYIINEFPTESALNYRFNTLHFSQVIEGHGGDSLFYFHNLRTIYGGGQLVPFLIIISVIVFLYRIKSNLLRIAFTAFISVVYLFFTLAATKMVSFCYIVSPFIFLSLGAVIDGLIEWISSKLNRPLIVRGIFAIVVLLLAVACFDPGRFAEKHLEWRNDQKGFYAEYYKDIKIIKSLDLPDNTLLLNCKGFQNIAAMFYNDLTAYSRLATADELIMAKQKGYNIVVFDNHQLPAFYYTDPAIHIIDLNYYRTEQITRMHGDLGRRSLH